MQHIVNIAFDFEDEKIRQKIEKEIEASVIEKMAAEIKKEYLEEKYGIDPAKEIIERIIQKIIKEKQEEIIEKAANLLSEKLYRSKAVKEAALEVALKER